MADMTDRSGRSVPTLPADALDLRRARRARAGRRVGIAVLAAFVVAGGLGLLGVRRGVAVDRGAGIVLRVEYPRVTRPGLSIPWRVVVGSADGFAEPVRLATTAAYLELFDWSTLAPEPTEQTRSGELLILTFPPPAGRVLEVSFDGRTGPSVQRGMDARTSVWVDGQEVVGVDYSTVVMP